MWVSGLQYNGMEIQKMKIDDAYLYEHMPEAERCLMELIPPEEELNHVFSRRFERKMKALLKYERRTPWERKFYRGMKIAFAALAVILVLAFSSAMSVKASRLSIIEFFVEVFEELTSYSAKDAKQTGEIAHPVEPKYIPEGYQLTQRTDGNSGYSIVFEDVEGNRITYRQLTLGGLEYLWNTEECETKEIEVKDYVVKIIEEETMYTIYWNDDECTYRIIGPKQIAVDELLEMARSVMKQ